MIASPFTSRARSYVRSRATAVMTYQCRAERPARPSYDETTLVAIPGTEVELFSTMPCRIWEIQGAQALNIGEAELMIENLQLSVPYDAPLLKKYDEIVITNTPVQDITLLNKRFQVVSSARAGELRATRRYQVRAVE